MKVIGLCGGSGSGKGAVGKIFADADIPVIDTDAVYHTLTASDSECLRELADYFGDSIISDSGALDRRALAEIVFSSDSVHKRQTLNRIAHGHVLARVREMIGEFALEGYCMAVVDAPLLYESGFNDECDVIIAVIADRNTRVARITKRDGLTEAQAQKRIDAQIADDVLKDRADYVVYNNGTLSDLEASVVSIISELKSK